MTLTKITTTRLIAIKTTVLIAIATCLCGFAAAQASPLTIPDQTIPPLSAGTDFRTFLHAMGGTPPYTWSVASGDLPDGIILTPEGCLCGRPAKPGALTMVLKVEDSGQPAHSITKDFHLSVSASLLLEWLDAPAVHDDRIDGSVKVSNGSKDEYDLTVIIVAVAENGRATALGYQHFPLKPETTDFPITFGTTLPHGAYVIHADAIAEIPARKNILRQRLQTPGPLQVVVGP
jgi:hypothetical protein